MTRGSPRPRRGMTIKAAAASRHAAPVAVKTVPYPLLAVCSHAAPRGASALAMVIGTTRMPAMVAKRRVS